MNGTNSSAKHYDRVVTGSGAAGHHDAIQAAKLGKRLRFPSLKFPLFVKNGVFQQRRRGFRLNDGQPGSYAGPQVCNRTNEISLTPQKSACGKFAVAATFAWKIRFLKPTCCG
jgi:hypothetical protein